MDSNNAKQAQRWRPEQPIVFYGTQENLITSVVTCKLNPNESQRRKKRWSHSHNKSRGKDHHFNKTARELELVFNTIQERNRHCLDEICKQNRFRAFSTNSKDVNKAFSI
jgi:hypothetical protein